MRKRRSSDQIDEENLLPGTESEFVMIRGQKRSIHSIPAVYGLFLLIYLICVHLAVVHYDKRLPTPLTIKDEVKNPDRFIAERARDDLKTLTNIGPRVVGSYENEVLAVQFLLRELEQIKSTSKGRVEIDLQTVNGSYFLNFKPYGVINTYAEMQNVVVKFSSGRNRDSPQRTAILVNSHFDSVPTSPGGSDDGIMVVTMLEVLRKLCKSSSEFKHDLIFLFNGAEESSLQASHGFITQHRWLKGLKLVVNLEAAGAGSKEILFQTGPGRSWLLDHYASVPHPHGQAAGEEIFQSNLIPSDTDFRVFRDFGGLFGFDFAFYRNGYRYHTKFDGFANIPLGSYQHVGDNILQLLRSLMDAPELDRDDGQDRSKAVYFDFLGLFFVKYSTGFMHLLHLSVCLASLLVAVHAFRHFHAGLAGYKYLFCSASALLSGWMLAVVGVFFIATVTDRLGASMSWYAHPWLLFGLYFAPAVAQMALPTLLLNWVYANRFSPAVQALAQAHLARLVFTGILFIGTLLGVRSTYALMVPVLFNSVGCLVITAFKLQYTVWGWRLSHLVANLLPTIFGIYFYHVLFAMFIPVTGRIGSDKNPDLIIGMVSCLFVILIGTFYINFLVLMRSAHRFVILLACIFLVFWAMALLRYPGGPYSGDPRTPRPQRHWIFHTDRKFHSENGSLERADSGYFMLNMDRNSPGAVRGYVPEIGDSVPIQGDCHKYLYCGLPLSHSRMVQIMEASTWIPTAEAPPIEERVQVQLERKEVMENGVLNYHFVATGPDHMSIFFRLLNDAQMLNTSLVPNMDEFEATWWRGQQVVFIKYCYGKQKVPLKFSVELKAPLPYPEGTKFLEMVGSGLYGHGQKHTEAFNRFLGRFPKWADVTPALASYESRFH